jgi:membrane protein implicated in regulation of membrane protease activity
MGRGSFLDSPIFLPLLGLISILIALFYRPVFLLFFGFALFAFGVWFAEIWQRKGGSVRRQGQETDTTEEDKTSSGRKTG